MTIVFSSISVQSDLITITVDSSVTRALSTDQIEYDKGRKIYCYEGVGCVATWGSRDHNKIGEFLEKQDISSAGISVSHLAEIVNSYLTQVYKPHDLGLDDVGYHIAGFNKNGEPRLFHVFWGTNRPRNPFGETRAYHYQTDLSHPGLLLYNGRNDLAEAVINTLLHEMRSGQETNIDLANHISLIDFGDFVTRFASEITPQVDKPFITTLISPQNNIRQVINRDFCPINVDLVVDSLVKLGYTVRGNVLTKHERIIQELPSLIRRLLDNSQASKALSSQVWIAKSSVIEGSPHLYLSSEIMLQPDFLLCMPNGQCRLGDDDCWHGPPDLIIEVLSLETERADRGYKFEVYRDHGVQEYWMINPKNQFLEVWNFDRGQAQRVGVFGVGDEEFESRVLSCKIDQINLEALLGIAD